VSSLISFIVAIFLGFVLFGTAWMSPEATRVEVEPAVVTQASSPLEIEGSPADRIGRSSPDAMVAYAATSQGLYLLEGRNDWDRVGDTPGSGQIVFDAANPDVMMVGQAEDCGRGGGGSPLALSSDGGATWTSPEGDATPMTPLAIWSADNLAVGASCAGLLVSNAEGDSWEHVREDLLGLTVTAFAVVEGHEQTILAGLTGEGGTTRLYQFDLTDQDSWATAEPIAEYWGIAGIAGSADTVYLASITGVSSSSDGGVTWSTDRSGLQGITLEQDPTIDGLPEGVDPTGKGLNAIYLHDGQPALVGGESAVYEYWNTDVRPSESPTWEELLPTSGRITAFASTPEPGTVLVETESGVWTVSPQSLAS
jgi:hypothetical protein